MFSFGTLSLLAAFLTSLLLLERLSRASHVLVKPSFIVILFLNVTNQWSSALLAPLIEQLLPNPWDYFFVVQLFPPLLLLFSLRFHDAEARKVHDRIKSLRFDQLASTWPHAIHFLAIAAGGVLLWYLWEVPLRETGLYAMIFDPARANVAREESMKLIRNDFLKYAYAVFSTTLSPVLAVLLALASLASWSKKKYGNAVGFLLGILLVLLAVSIYGARAPSAMILLTIIYAFLIRFYRGNPLKWAMVLPVVLIIPAVFSSVRDFGELTWDGLGIHFFNVADRAFGRGIQDGVAHILYAQQKGFFGVRGMGNLATLFGETPVDTFNVVGREFLFTGIDSVSANTTFIIAYYGCVGLWSFLICALCLLFLDRITFLCRKIETEYLLPCVAAYQLAASNLVGTLFTTIFVTYGFALIPFLCWFLGRLQQDKKVRFHDPVSQTAKT